MNRKQEFLELMDELERSTPELRPSVKKAQSRRKRVALAFRSFSGAAACFVLFVVLVNFYAPAAYACAKVPVLRELAAAVTFSRSLTDAVENDYDQELKLTQTQNGVTAEVAYLIVDQKQVNVFYRLHADSVSELAAEPVVRSTDGGPLSSCSYGTSYGDTADGLNCVTIDFMEQDVPDSLRLGLRVYSNAKADAGAAPVQQADRWEEPEEREDDLAAFDFLLEFDPQFTAQGRVLPVSRTVKLDGQKLTVTQVEIYPTHLRVDVAADPANTAWLKRLDFCIETDSGMRFSPISNGITATGDENSPAMVSYRADSTYFYEASQLRLVISGAQWLRKDLETIRVNLRTGETDPLPEGIAFDTAEQQGTTWTVTFRANYTEGEPIYQLFGSTCYDARGNAHEIDAWSNSFDTPDEDGNITCFLEQFPLRDYPDDEVWLSPLFSNTWTADSELIVPIS